jgi:sodium/proline symporter
MDHAFQSMRFSPWGRKTLKTILKWSQEDIGKMEIIMTTSIVIFALYMAVLIFIGIFFFKRASSLSDYFIGGRRLNAPVAALSAHASDMSGWLMLGFTGAVYMYGMSRIWIAAGLALGTILNWIFVAKRLRRYTIMAGSSITMPEFFENRFQDSSHLLRFVSAAFIMIFFTVYTASGFVACGTLFSAVFGIDYQLALLIGAVIILIYTFLGGFRAVCWTDFIQDLMLLAAIIAVPLIMLYFVEGFTGLVQNTVPEFFSITRDITGKPLSAVSIISELAWGLGYFGIPHILIRFMAVKNERSILPAAVISGFTIIISLGFAALAGAAGAVFIPGLDDPESMFIRAIRKIFMNGSLSLMIPGSIFLCGVLAAIMSTADSQILVTASAIANDIYRGLVHTEHSDRYFLRFSRISVAVIAFIAYVMATDRHSSVMSLTSIAWSGFGSCFGALILLSLYWKRINLHGAAAGIISGGLAVMIWEYMLCIPGASGWTTLHQATGLYSLAPAFVISLGFIIAVSLATKAPPREVTEQFEQAASPPIFEE